MCTNSVTSNMSRYLPTENENICVHTKPHKNSVATLFVIGLD